jgi:hypothetical protein
MIRTNLGRSRVRESRMLGSVGAKLNGLASFCRETRKSLLDRCLTVSLDMHVCHMAHMHRHAT